MNRQTFAYLSVGLTVSLFVLGSMPLAAADSPNLPLGITETPVATETATNTPPAPTATPTPTRAPAQAPANTPAPTATIALTPTSTPAVTATSTRVIVLPSTGGPDNAGGTLQWIPEIIALIVGGLAALLLGADRRAMRPDRR